mgnify:CR=1 FL=1
MIGKETIKNLLGVEWIVSNEMTDAITLWAKMYINDAPWLTTDVKSLNLPAAIASEIARMTTIEMNVLIEGSARADYLNSIFKKSVLDKIRPVVEYGVAKGGLIFKPYIENRKTLAIDFIQADMFFPVRFDSNRDLMACIFADQKEISGKYYTRLEYHDHTDTEYVIRNMAFRSSNKDTLGSQVPLDTVPDWAGFLPEATIMNVERPLYAYFRFPLANNIDTTSPLGVSCYSRAVDLIKDVDKQWSNLVWEFESGQRALFVDVLAFGQNDEGKPRLPNKRLYRTIDTGGDKDSFFEEWSPEFREASILSGLDAMLKKIEFECGLAYGTVSDPAVEVKTATEIKTSKQRTYTTITDTQKALENTLEHLLYAMDVWATLGNLAPRGTYTTTYDFDDSVIVDKEAQMTSDRQTAMGGMMPKYMFLMRNYKLDEVTAKKWISETQAEMQSVADLIPDEE